MKKRKQLCSRDYRHNKQPIKEYHCQIDNGCIYMLVLTATWIVTWFIGVSL